MARCEVGVGAVPTERTTMQLTIVVKSMMARGM